MAIVKFDDVVVRANTKEDRFNTDKIYYVGGEHIDSNEVTIKNRGLIEGSTIGPMFYFGFKAGQVLFVTRNPHLRKAGWVDFDGICSEKTFVLETKDENVLCQRFLPFIMQSDHFWNYCEANKSGSVNFFINWSTLAKYEFELPDIQTQRKLADLLWAMERTKQAYKQLISATDELVKSQFIDLFGNPISFEKDSSLPIIGDLCTLKAGSFVRADSISDSQIGSLYPCYGGNGMRGFVSDFTHDGDYPIIGRQGALCGNVQYVSGKFHATEHAVVVTPKIQMDRYWLYYLLLLLDLNRYATGAAQPGLAVNKLEKIHISCPKYEEQKQYASFARQTDKSKYSTLFSLSSLSGPFRPYIP